MKRDFDAAAKGWDQNPGRLQVSLAVAEAMAGALALSGRETVLDYGTGTGIVALRLAPGCREVICADSSAGMLEVLRGKIAAAGLDHLRPLQLDLTGPAPAPALPPLDAVVSSMALHHIADTAALARRFHALLAPGGRLALADLDLDRGEFHDDNTGVEHFGFDRAALAALFTAAGFEGVEVTTAHTLRKPTRAGPVKEFSIFLLTARRAQER